jgi:cbb3-type cytochrome oxidase subunit 3
MMEWLAAYGPMIVLPVFMVMFVGYGFWAYRPSNKTHMDKYGEIPFKESHDGNE